MSDPVTWRVRLADDNPSRLAVILLAAAAAGLVGFALFHSLVSGLLGVLVIGGSTMEYWFGVTYRLDESGATSQNGPSVSKIAWSDVRQLIVNDHGVTLSPLEGESRLAAFRGVFLRPGPLGMDDLIEKLKTYGGEDVRRLV